jgi:DNA-binding CsgD family transcriptional regulator
MAGAFGDFGTLTEAFMAAAVDPSRWDAAMDDAAKATGSFGAALQSWRGRLPQFPISERLLPVAETFVREGWVDRDIRYRVQPAIERLGVGTDSDVLTPEEAERHPFYQDFLGRHGLRWFAGVKIGQGDQACLLSIQRSLVEGPFASAELHRLTELSRHLVGAAELACAFGFARMEAALQAFEASRSAVAMVNHMGEVVRLNRSAEGLLGPDLQITRRRIICWSRDATVALDRALHDLIWRRGPKALQSPVVLPRQNGRPIVAYPSRLPNAVREGFALVQGFVVFADLEARPCTLATDLMRVFGLTAAEARLADRLLRDDSLEAAAESLGVSYSTARNQLRAVYQKTDTHSQAQLIALISRLAKPQIRGA